MRNLARFHLPILLLLILALALSTYLPELNLDDFSLPGSWLLLAPLALPAFFLRHSRKSRSRQETQETPGHLPQPPHEPLALL
ncbi:MAG: hypothetical protein KC441_08210 [Anaerolineales bacterium]|nr:hypothetical protein [Anaerolineales bacterium]